MRLFFCFLCFGAWELSAQDFIVGSIQIEGNKLTKSEIVLREIPLNQGQVISGDSISLAIEQIKRNLLNTSLFNYVTVDTSLSNGFIHFTILLEERWFLWPYPIFEQADRNLPAYFNNKEWDRINYGFYVVRYNFRGRKEIIKAKIRLGYKEQYALYYEKPYLNKSKTLGLIADFSWFQQKEVLYRIEKNKPLYTEGENYLRKEIRVFASLLYRPDLYQRFKLTVGYNLLQVADTVLGLNHRYLLRKSPDVQYLLNLEGTHDKRDSWVYPLRGYFLQAGISAITNPDGNTYGYFNGKAQAYLCLGQRHFIQITSELAGISEREPSFTRSLALGTDQFVRGFEYYLMTGYSYYILKPGYKFQVMKKKVFHFDWLNAPSFDKIHLSAFLSVFSDFGYIWAQDYHEQNNYCNRHLKSAGVGFDLVSYYDKVLRLEYTINNFGFKAFYIHLGAGI